MKELFRRELWDRRLVSWYLFDFAQALAAVNITLYFSQWAVVERNVPDFWFAFPFIFVTVILIFLLPYLGALSDRKGSHYRLYYFSSLLAIISIIGMYLSGRYISGPFLGVFAALLFYGLYQFFLQMSVLPYSAFIKYISKPEEYGKISGLGYAFGQAGWIAGLLLTLPIILHENYFGDARLFTLVPATVGFIVFALPSFFTLRFPIPPAPPKENEPPKGLLVFWHNLKESRKYPGVLPLLVAFYFFSDAIVTLTLFAAIFLQNVFDVGDTLKAVIFILVEVGFLIGAFVAGPICDRRGYRSTLLISLSVTSLSVAVLAFAPSVSWCYVLFSIFGLGIGFVYTITRAYLASLVPQSETGTYFGLYVFAERFSSIIGPTVWSLLVWFFAAHSPFNYRLAAFGMSILVAVGILFLVILKRGPIIKEL